jgi:hypothetical protein
LGGTLVTPAPAAAEAGPARGLDAGEYDAASNAWPTRATRFPLRSKMGPPHMVSQSRTTRPPLEFAQLTVATLRAGYAMLARDKRALCRPRQRVLAGLDAALKLVAFARQRGWPAALLVDLCRQLAEGHDYIPNQLRAQEMQLRLALQWLQSNAGAAQADAPESSAAASGSRPLARARHGAVAAASPRAPAHGEAGLPGSALPRHLHS